MSRHANPRKRPLIRRRGHGRWLHMGPQVIDAVNGWPVPERETVVQRGRKVSREYRDGSRDRPDKSRF